MLVTDFTSWLQGYLEHATNGLSQTEVEIILHKIENLTREPLIQKKIPEQPLMRC